MKKTNKAVVKITVNNLQRRIPIYARRIKKTILNALMKEGFKKEGEITISFVSDGLISCLNAKYLDNKKATDVLAFNLTDSSSFKVMIADIIISADTALRNSKIFKTTLFYELNLYALHGVLHLLGYNDRNPKDAKLMRKKESRYVHS